RNVLTQEDIEQSVNEIWDLLELRLDDGSEQIREFRREMRNSLPPADWVQRDNPDTWTLCWPRGDELGMLGGNVVWTPQAMRNRQNENLMRVFEMLLGTDDLLVQFDRYGCMRPTKNIRVPFTAHLPFGDNLTVPSDW